MTASRKVALVTGGSRGIGYGIAEALAAAGYDVAITALQQEGLDSAVTSLKTKANGDMRGYACDLRDPAASRALIDAIIADSGRLDVLINNAASGLVGSFLNLSDEDWIEAFAVKFHAAVRMTRLAWPHLKAQRGDVITIGGTLGKIPDLAFVMGGACVSALLNMSKALAELGRVDGVSVNMINPGWIKTERFDAMLDQISADNGISRDAAAENLMQAVKITGFAEPRDIAAMTLFILNSKPFIHGAALDLDSGMTKGL